MIIHWSSIDIQKKYNRNSIEINRDPMAGQDPIDIQKRTNIDPKGDPQKIQRRSNP